MMDRINKFLRQDITEKAGFKESIEALVNLFEEK